MDTARQHFLESETDKETQTEELSNYSGDETPRIKRKRRQTQSRNSKQKQQCQLIVQQDRGRGCQHFASLQSKKRSRRSSQSRQATPRSELELAPDVDFVAGRAHAMSSLVVSYQSCISLLSLPTFASAC
jgi:hypothetical protein